MMGSLAERLTPPYYAAILGDTQDDYFPDFGHLPADKMVTLAPVLPGFLGLETAHDPKGDRVTVAYWKDMECLEGWKAAGDAVINEGFGIRLADVCDIWISRIGDERRVRSHLEYIGYETPEGGLRGVAAFVVAVGASLTGFLP